MNMRASCGLASLILACVFAATAGTAHAISVGELADFTGGNNGWRQGFGNWPILSGGQDGPTDDFLSIQAAGGGGGLSRFVALNTSPEWTGDFTTAGISGLSFDVLNESGTTLEIRFAVNGPGGLFSTTTSASISSSNQWQNASVSFDPANFTSVSGNSGSSGTDINATLAGVSELRILHNPSPAWVGEAIQLTAGFDNIEALGASFDPADFNEDTLVDETDLGIWQAAYGSDAAGDANNDSATDGADFVIWQQNFAPGIPAVQAVPEPSSVALLSLAGFALMTFRRKP